MEFIAIVVAAAASYAFGAVWYMVLAKPWMKAAGVEADENGKPANANQPWPYIAAFLCALIVSGMMRHVFALSGIDTLASGLVAGLGIGLFFATPWIITNYGFANRPRILMAIDGGYATIGCMMMGFVHGLL